MSKGIREGERIKEEAERKDEAEQKLNEKQSSKYRKTDSGSGDWLEAVITSNVLCLHRALREVEDTLCGVSGDKTHDCDGSRFHLQKKKTHKEMFLKR